MRGKFEMSVEITGNNIFKALLFNLCATDSLSPLSDET